MKRILRRFLIYWIIIGCLITVFQAWPSPIEGEPFSIFVGEIIGLFIFAFGFWSIVFEGIYWMLRAFGAFKPKQKPGE